MLRNLLDQLSWPLLIVAALALGLAPFIPEPHLVEKLRMLAQGTLQSLSIYSISFSMQARFCLLF